MLISVVETLLHPGAPGYLASHAALSTGHQPPQLSQTPVNDPGVGEAELSLVIAWEHVKHLTTLGH